MANDMSEIRSTLNDVIEICKDSEEGFRSAAEKLKDPQIHTLFLKYSLQRTQFAGELQSEVTRIGGEPAKSGSTAGAMHRGWIGLKSALTGDSDHAVLEEAERGEDAAVKAYRDALGKNLPSDLQSIVSRQYHEVQQTHNAVRELRDTNRIVVSAPAGGSI